MKSIKLFGALLTSLFLSGCLSNTPPPQHYLLHTSAVTHAKKPLFRAPLNIAPVQSYQAWGSTGFMYRLSEYEYQIDYYHRFLISPDTMMTEIVTENLAQSGLFKSVQENNQLLEAPHYSLTLYLLKFYADYQDLTRPLAVISFKVNFSGNAALGEHTSFQKIFTAEIPLQDNTSEDLINAWQTGMNQITNDIIKTIQAHHPKLKKKNIVPDMAPQA